MEFHYENNKTQQNKINNTEIKKETEEITKRLIKNNAKIQLEFLRTNSKEKLGTFYDKDEKRLKKMKTFDLLKIKNDPVNLNRDENLKIDEKIKIEQNESDDENNHINNILSQNISKNLENDFKSINSKENSANKIKSNINLISFKDKQLSFLTKEKKIVNMINTRDFVHAAKNENLNINDFNSFMNYENESKAKTMKNYNKNLDYYKFQHEVNKKQDLNTKFQDNFLKRKLIPNYLNKEFDSFPNENKYISVADIFNNKNENTNKLRTTFYQDLFEKNKIFNENFDGKQNKNVFLDDNGINYNGNLVNFDIKNQLKLEYKCPKDNYIDIKRNNIYKQNTLNSIIEISDKKTSISIMTKNSNCEYNTVKTNSDKKYSNEKNNLCALNSTISNDTNSTRKYENYFYSKWNLQKRDMKNIFDLNKKFMDSFSKSKSKKDQGYNHLINVNRTSIEKKNNPIDQKNLISNFKNYLNDVKNYSDHNSSKDNSFSKNKNLKNHRNNFLPNINIFKPNFIPKDFIDDPADNKINSEIFYQQNKKSFNKEENFDNGKNLEKNNDEENKSYSNNKNYFLKDLENSEKAQNFDSRKTAISSRYLHQFKNNMNNIEDIDLLHERTNCKKLVKPFTPDSLKINIPNAKDTSSKKIFIRENNDEDEDEYELSKRKNYEFSNKAKSINPNSFCYNSIPTEVTYANTVASKGKNIKKENIKKKEKIRKLKEIINLGKGKKLEEIKIEMNDEIDKMNNLGDKIKNTVEFSTKEFTEKLNDLQDKYYSRYIKEWQNE